MLTKLLKVTFWTWLSTFDSVTRIWGKESEVRLEGENSKLWVKVQRVKDWWFERSKCEWAILWWLDVQIFKVRSLSESEEFWVLINVLTKVMTSSKIIKILKSTRFLQKVGKSWRSEEKSELIDCWWFQQRQMTWLKKVK